MPAIPANALYMDRYPLVSALSRPLIARHLVETAQHYGAGTVSHGCTGKGNDQVRFEVGISTLDPSLKVIAPVRDYAWTREKAIAYAEERSLPIETTKRSPFSVDQNLWGAPSKRASSRTSGMPRTKDIYSYTESPDLSAAPDELVLTFTAGVPTAIDGRALSPLEVVQELNQRAGAAGVGRLDLVEDRLVGIKSREIYEAPGAIALITAHQELENVTVERDLARFKKGVDQRWGELVYDGLWFSPLKKALDTFIGESQQAVSGDVRLILHAGRAVVTGRRSETSLYDFGLATYDAGDTFDQSQARGFIELWGLPSRLASARDARLAARQTPGR